MPHIKISMYPGRNDAEKRKIAEKMRDALTSECGIPKEVISVSIEEVEPDKWEEEMKKIPQGTMFIQN